MWFVRDAVAALVSPLGTALALGVLAGCLLVLGGSLGGAGGAFGRHHAAG
jgi:hypothetical protein